MGLGLTRALRDGVKVAKLRMGRVNHLRLYQTLLVFCSLFFILPCVKACTNPLRIAKTSQNFQALPAPEYITPRRAGRNRKAEQNYYELLS